MTDDEKPGEKPTRRKIWDDERDRYLALAKKHDNAAQAVVGSILLTHLTVQHYLIDLVQALNPNLGPIEEFGRAPSFHQLLVLLSGGTRGKELVEYIGPAVRALNAIRNDIAHTLTAQAVKKEHVQTLYDLIVKEKLQNPVPPLGTWEPHVTIRVGGHGICLVLRDYKIRAMLKQE